MWHFLIRYELSENQKKIFGFSQCFEVSSNIQEPCSIRVKEAIHQVLDKNHLTISSYNCVIQLHQKIVSWYSLIVLGLPIDNGSFSSVIDNCFCHIVVYRESLFIVHDKFISLCHFFLDSLCCQPFCSKKKIHDQLWRRLDLKNNMLTKTSET